MDDDSVRRMSLSIPTDFDPIAVSTVQKNKLTKNVNSIPLEDSVMFYFNNKNTEKPNKDMIDPRYLIASEKNITKQKFCLESSSSEDSSEEKEVTTGKNQSYNDHLLEDNDPKDPPLHLQNPLEDNGDYHTSQSTFPESSSLFLEQLIDNLDGSQIEITKLANEFVEKTKLKKKNNILPETKKVQLLSTKNSLVWAGVKKEEINRKELNICLDSSLSYKVKAYITSPNFRLKDNNGQYVSNYELKLSPKVNKKISVFFCPKDHYFYQGHLFFQIPTLIHVKVHLFGYAGSPNLTINRPIRVINEFDKNVVRTAISEANCKRFEISVTNCGSRPAFVAFYDFHQTILQFIPQRFLIHSQQIKTVSVISNKVSSTGYHDYGVVFVDECLRRAAKISYNKGIKCRSEDSRIFSSLEIFLPFPEEESIIFEQWPNINCLKCLKKQIFSNFFQHRIYMEDNEEFSTTISDHNDSFDSVKTISAESTKHSSGPDSNGYLNDFVNSLRIFSNGDLENIIIKKNKYEFPLTPLKHKSLLGILIRNNSSRQVKWTIERIRSHLNINVVINCEGLLQKQNFVIVPVLYEPITIGTSESEFTVRVSNLKMDSFFEKNVVFTGTCEQKMPPTRSPVLQTFISDLIVEKQIIFDVCKSKSNKKLTKTLQMDNKTGHQLEIFCWVDSHFIVKEHIILDVNKQTVPIQLNLSKCQSFQFSSLLLIVDSEGNCTTINLVVKDR